MRSCGRKTRVLSELIKNKNIIFLSAYFFEYSLPTTTIKILKKKKKIGTSWREDSCHYIRTRSVPTDTWFFAVAFNALINDIQQPLFGYWEKKKKTQILAHNRFRFHSICLEFRSCLYYYYWTVRSRHSNDTSRARPRSPA